MYQDSITEEIRAIRRSLAEQCGNDVRKIVAEAQRLESADGRRYQTLTRRRRAMKAKKRDSERGEQED